MRLLASLIFILSLTIANAKANTMIILGDSLSAAYGFPEAAGWVAKLKERTQKTHPCCKIINLSTSGDTSLNGLIKLKSTLKKVRPTSLIIELGGNDALRGISLKTTEKNLSEIIKLAKAIDSKILLLATRLPPNYGAVYTNTYAKMYERLSEQEAIPLIPMMLKNVAGNPSLMQTDGLHPNANAQDIILQNLWPSLKEQLTPC